MSEIIKKTYQLLDTLDNSKLIKDLTESKNKLEKNTTILSLIEKYKLVSNNEEKIKIKKELYSHTEYETYQKCYNELSLIILQINKKYKEYTNTKEHSHG